jgi:hypothetical protein
MSKERFEMTPTPTTDQQKRAILESMFAGPTFTSPDVEYGYRGPDFLAEIPQTGERWESREALREMQSGFGAPPAVRLERIRGQGDLWVVEAVQTYQRHGEQHTCVIVEFEGDKIARETRYYAPSSTPPERG